MLGDVTTPGVLALNSVGERLLALIARAGGPRFEAVESYVTLQRNGKQVKVLLSRVVHDPRENIFIRPNDVIFVTHEAPSFTALGALNQNTFGFDSEIAFDVETLTMAQAIGKAGDSTISSPIPPRFMSTGMRTVTFWRSSASTQQVHLRSHTDYLSSQPARSVRLFACRRLPDALQGRHVRPNARVVDYYKLLTLINNTATTTSNTANAVTSVNTAVKTRW